jgi:hypothetical protein
VSGFDRLNGAPIDIGAIYFPSGLRILDLSQDRAREKSTAICAEAIRERSSYRGNLKGGA